LLRKNTPGEIFEKEFAEITSLIMKCTIFLRRNYVWSVEIYSQLHRMGPFRTLLVDVDVDQSNQQITSQKHAISEERVFNTDSLFFIIAEITSHIMKPLFKENHEEQDQDIGCSHEEVRFRPPRRHRRCSHAHRVHSSDGSERQQLEQLPQGARSLRRVLQDHRRGVVSKERVPNTDSLFCRSRNIGYNETYYERKL
jgi:hypothetical protein